MPDDTASPGGDSSPSPSPPSPSPPPDDSSPAAPTKTIRLVCAGLGRTGTLSLAEALEILGYKPYHFIDFRHASDWADLAEGRVSSPGVVLDRIVDDGYDAVLENPTCDVYQEFLARFPDARVVLTVRDSPAAFEASWKILMDTMVVTERPFRWSFPSFFGWIPLFRNLRSVRRFLGTTHLGLEPGALAHGWRELPEGWLGEQYEKHNKHVVESVPGEKLLVFNVREGWKPLCAFLGCEVPDRDFPHRTINNAGSLENLRTKFLVAVYGWIPAVALAATGAVCLGRRWTPRARR